MDTFYCTICKKEINDRTLLLIDNSKKKGFRNQCKLCIAKRNRTSKGKLDHRKCIACNKTITIGRKSIDYCNIDCKLKTLYKILPNGCWEWIGTFEKNKVDYKTPRFIYRCKSIYPRKKILLDNNIECNFGIKIISTCGLKYCIKLEHLKQVSNLKEFLEKRPSLTKKQKSDILQKVLIEKWPLTEIAQLHNVSRTSIYRITKKHLEEKSKHSMSYGVNSDQDAQKELERIQKELGL